MFQYRMAVHFGDCFTIFPTLKTASVDMVLVDIPYGATAERWDVPLDLPKMWHEILRIGKPSCRFVFFCNTKLGYELIKSNEKMFRTDIVWKKPRGVGHLTANRCLLRQHEMIYVFSKAGTSPTYNPQMSDGIMTNTQIVRGYECIYGKKTKGIKYQGTTDRFPTTIIEFGHPDKNEIIHPTQKPVALCEWLIKTYSNQGDVILDFTAGSGTTAIACLNTDRHYILIEKELHFYEGIMKRINVPINTLASKQNISADEPPQGGEDSS